MMKGEQGESEDKKRVLTKKKEMNNGRVLKKGVTLERIFMFLLFVLSSDSSSLFNYLVFSLVFFSSFPCPLDFVNFFFLAFFSLAFFFFLFPPFFVRNLSFLLLCFSLLLLLFFPTGFVPFTTVYKISYFRFLCFSPNKGVS
ncbi:hypothetical protein BDQ94DRAFT_429 [Aspergillus welwitschiae]|uniref:Transmembrane protein n=1 Tax=Aspergillus welwitschiae TaxID=1341132 RepID=A0A3F3QI35_9EURO|nr:hypothetical protein BDQ94DRAFT_429 [Aspergillus welwitschiae]RDH38974.1 hypothetical protein BDQ94DRAFT_429 [Aspergillus welwitschiae]